MFKEQKNILRKKVLELLRNQKEEERLKKSLAILEKLFAIPEVIRAKTILFYAAFDGEVDTFAMMKQAFKLGKRVALPLIILEEKKMIPVLVNNLEKDLEPGPFGIKQPRFLKAKALSPPEIDLVVVPGVAFDRDNHRLGRGAGYYDRFLQDLPGEIPTIGLAFDFQVFESLPRQEHDIRMSRVLVN